jgi:hypothetical protein
MTERGIILVSDNGITVRCQQRDETTEVTYDETTIENLQDGARILAGWMNLKFEDTASECRRVHKNDQFDAFLREFVQGK